MSHENDQGLDGAPARKGGWQCRQSSLSLIQSGTPASESERTAIEAAARTVGQQTEVFSASTETHIERAFIAIAPRHLGTLLVTGDPFFFACGAVYSVDQAPG